MTVTLWLEPGGNPMCKVLHPSHFTNDMSGHFRPSFNKTVDVISLPSRGPSPRRGVRQAADRDVALTADVAAPLLRVFGPTMAPDDLARPPTAGFCRHEGVF